MQNSLLTDDIKVLVDIVGRQGAIVALEGGTKHKLQQLSEFAKKHNIDAGEKPTKKTLSALIVRHVDKRIQKSLDELMRMSKEDLISYFKEIDCDQEDLLDLVNSVGLKARAKSKPALLEFVSSELHSLGVFDRLSNGTTEKEKHRKIYVLER